MADHPLDVGGFRDWALGNLVDNAARGWFAEWLVAKALGVIGDGDTRAEWDSVDLRYKDLKDRGEGLRSQPELESSQPVDAELGDRSPQDGLGRGYRHMGEFRSAQANC